MATGGEEATAAQRTSVVGSDSAIVHFRLDYKQFMEHPAGEAIHTDAVSVGGQLWRIDCYPGGTREHHPWSLPSGHHRYVSIFLRRLTASPSTSSSANVKAIFEPFFLGSDGMASPKITNWASVHEYHETSNKMDPAYDFGDDDLGYPEFHERSALERYVVDGNITFLCVIMVVNELSPVPVPASDLGDHLGRLLEDETTADVSFIVGGETFHAHRAVLAARSPVFKAQLFGSMLDAKQSTITLHEIAPSMFKAMLRFMYMDDWPGDASGHDDSSSVEMFQDLLAAADRYALDRLKFMCARKLSDNVSIDTVVTILVCAETYGCLELRKKCLKFCALDENFKQVPSSDTYEIFEPVASIAAETTRVAGVDSALVHMRVDYKQFMEFPAGKALSSDVVSVGGQLWRIDLYPRGIRPFHQHVSIFLRRLTTSASSTCTVKAIFEPFFLGRDGGPSPKITNWAHVHEYNECSDRAGSSGYVFGADDLGYPEFHERRSVVHKYVIGGNITFVCAIVVVNELSHVPVPPSDLGDHLGRLLEDDMMMSTDVSFLVGGETFCAHRVVLAARSPVFKAQLFGSMCVTSAPIVLHDIAPTTFRAILRFMYTDAWPGDNDSSSLQMFRDLLAAADRYGLDRLKLMCARRLWDDVSVHTVASILVCAETYGCQELKRKCLDFCARKKNFKRVASTDDYALLALRFPSIICELIEHKVGASSYR